jgi:hypothetical protein
MTHESTPSSEHDDGPEHDHTLPDADSIPTYETPEESDAALLDADLDFEED